ncbi:MAG: alkaline phosphatase family protein [Candidatus Dormiibacterota bacterium]
MVRARKRRRPPLPLHTRPRTPALRRRRGVVVRISFGLLALIGGLALAALPGLHLSTASAGLGVVQSFGGATSAITSSLSVSPNTDTAQGDLLVATIKSRDLAAFETVAGVTDSAGNTWTLVDSVTQGHQADEEIWYAPDAAAVGAGGSITVTLSGNAAIAMTILEIAGASSTPLHGVADAGDHGTAASTGDAPASPQDIVIADVGWNANVTPGGQTPSFTPTPVEQATAAGSMTGEQAAWEIVNNGQTVSYGATLSTPVAWAAAIATFSAVAVAPPTPTPTGTASGTPTPTSTPTPPPTPTPTSTPTSTPTPSPGPTPTVSPTPSPSTAPATRHVMLIMEENKGYAATLGSCGSDPYLCSLASQYASYTNWSGVGHPSLPNYLAFDSGSTQGCTTDSCPGPYAAADLGGELSKAGIPWTAYMESMPSACSTVDSSNGLYVKKHDPFIFFNDVLNSNCANNVVPYPGSAGLISDLNAAAAPQFVWVTPNLNDDMHDGTVTQGDAWLQANLAPVLSSSWFTNFDSTVIVTMDENDAQSSPAGGQVPLVVISRDAAGQGAISAPGNHYGTLRAIEEAFGLPYLGASADPSNGDPLGSF